MIITDDCIFAMAAMEPDSVDAVVTDPPYGLEFMGKEWDKFDRNGAASFVQTEKELKPMERFSGGRMIAKKSPYLDKPRWSTMGPKAISAFQAWCEAWGREALRVTKPGGYLLAFGGTRTHHRLVCGLEDAGWIIRDELDWIYASGFPKGRANLKPAHEPIVLARKPGPLRPLNIDQTRIEGAWSYPNGPGTGGFTTGKFMGSVGRGEKTNPHLGKAVESHPAGRWPSNLLLSDPELFDEPNPWVVGSGATSEPKPERTGLRGGTAWHGMESFGSPDKEGTWPADPGGGYSRFFIIPKADRADREPVLRGQLEKVPGGAYAGGEGMPGRTQIEGQWVQTPIEQRKARENSHPTTKPTDLMRHLIRLVTPPGGTVLDPFLGSGSTAIAAELEGFPWIGIEKEPEYVAIAEARLNGTQRGLGLDTPLVSPPNPQRARPDSKQVKWKPGVPEPAESSSWFHKPDEEPAA